MNVCNLGFSIGSHKHSLYRFSFNNYCLKKNPEVYILNDVWQQEFSGFVIGCLWPLTWISGLNFNVYNFKQAAYDTDINMAFVYSIINEFLVRD